MTMTAGSYNTDTGRFVRAHRYFGSCMLVETWKHHGLTWSVRLARPMNMGKFKIARAQRANLLSVSKGNTYDEDHVKAHMSHLVWATSRAV